MRLQKSLPATLSVLMLIVGGSAAGANADDLAGVADSVAAQIAEVAPEVGALVPPSPEAGSLVAVSDDVVVTAPKDGVGSVELRSSTVGTLDVSLPNQANQDAPVVASDGTVVYSGETSSTALQVLTAGDVRLQSISENEGAPSRYSYEFSDFVDLVLRGDGGAGITERTQSGSVVKYGEIDAPWAFDASGTPVQTYYLVEGNLLTQVITDPGTTYPVIADPKLTLGKRIYWSLTRTEQRYFGTMGSVAAAAYLCGQTVGLGCAAASAAAAGIGLYLSDRGGLCPTSAPWLQVGFAYGFPAQMWPGPSLACLKTV